MATGGLVLAYFAVGRKVDSDNALARLTEIHAQDGSSLIAVAHAYRGEHDEAFEWIAKAYERHDQQGILDLKVSQLWSNLHGDPRYEEWLRKLRLVDGH